MRVLFCGWEFPPAKTGGLGTHCYELVTNLGEKGLTILLLIPKRSEHLAHALRNVEIIVVDNDSLYPYSTASWNPYGVANVMLFEKCYGFVPLNEVDAFNKEIVARTATEQFDIIHCHDWMTVPAGIDLKRRTGKPLVLTIHSTEHDRTAGRHPSKYIVDIEKKGIEAADSVITVSRRMKRQLIERYQAEEKKTVVIYNGIDRTKYPGITEKNHRNMVLFLGRLTDQKGPSHFLHAAAKVLERVPHVLFLVCGQGEKLPELLEETGRLRIGKNVVFTGYLSEDELIDAYEMANVYVMPSVAEPFGIAALEAIASGTPVIVSENAGVTEIIKNCVTVNYQDAEEIANKVILLLKNPGLAESIRKKAFREIRDFSWNKVAQHTIGIYERLYSDNLPQDGVNHSHEKTG